jgi:hypothetical protein
MPLTVPTTIFPSERRAIGIAREATPGTGVLPVYTVPVQGFIPEDKPIWLPDTSMRAAMAETYGLIQGPYVADLSVENSPVYGDTIGHFLWNTLGDYTVTGTATGSVTTTTATLNPGATLLPVLSTSGFTSGMWVQIDTNGVSGPYNAEMVQFGSLVAGTATLTAATPIRLVHASTATVTNTHGAYTHRFSLLNGTANAQPPSHTLTDKTFINQSVFSRFYPFTCMSDITFTGNAEALFRWTGKGMGYAATIPASTPSVNISTVPAQPVWTSVVGLGGTAGGASQIYQIGEWEFNLVRVVEPYFTADGAQNPYVFGRGKFSTKGKMNFMPTIDETPLLDMLNNTQPQLQVIQTNNLTGSQLVSVQFDLQACAFDASVIEPGKALFGYNDTFQAIANTTNVGNSAGYSPLSVTVINNLPSY